MVIRSAISRDKYYTKPISNDSNFSLGVPVLQPSSPAINSVKSDEIFANIAVNSKPKMKPKPREQVKNSLLCADDY